MAAEVALSPKRSIMDFFKTPPKVSDVASSSKKSQGLLSFFTSTPRTQRPTACTAESSSQACVEGSSLQEKDGTKTASEELHQESQKTSTIVSSSTTIKQRSKLKTNKQEKQKVVHAAGDAAASGSRKSEGKQSEKNEESADKDTKDEANTTVQEQMDYEEFKRVLMQGGDPRQLATAANEQKDEDHLPIVDVHKEEEQAEERQTADVELKVSVADEREKEIKPVEVQQNEVNLSGDSTNPELDQEKRQLRTRTRRSIQPMSIPTPVLSPVSSKKDDGDLSLHGKDILEMTYEEYLKSIGAFDKSDTSNNESKVHVEQQADSKGGSTASVPLNSATPSLYNFFSKTTKSTKHDGKQEIMTVTVSAMVHGEPTVNRAMALKERAKNTRRLIKTAAHEKQASDESDEIEVLGSETISEDVRLVSETPAHPEQQNTVDLTEKTQNVHVSLEPQNSETAREEGAVGKTAATYKFVKRTQATLQFKKGGGLEMSTAVAKTMDSIPKTPCDFPAEEISKKTDKVENKKPSKRRRIASITDDSDGSCAEIDNKPAEESTPAVKSDQTTRLRTSRSLDSDSGNDTKDFTPRSKRASTAAQARAQELLMKASQQADLNKGGKNIKKRKSSTVPLKKQAISDDKESKPSPLTDSQHASVDDKTATPSDQGSRRQSSRLARQSIQEKNYIDLETESDSESDDSQAYSPVKKTVKKKDGCAEKRASTKSPKKSGKLAPVFTKLKGCGQGDTTPRPREDPEVVRKRQEFLMSGVPSELKRQVEASAQAAVVVSEFAPFPEINHVQQREAGEKDGLDVWALADLGKGLRLCEDVSEEQISVSDFVWGSLQWLSTSQWKGDPGKSISQSDAGTFKTEQRELLLKELQQTHPDCAVSAWYDRFKACFDGTERGKDVAQGAEENTEGHNVQNDSDVLVVDDKEEEFPSQSDKGSGGQWTEALQPSQASEMVGNASVLRRLHNWLEEWKMLIQKEARHTARMAANSSDLELSDSDTEDEPAQLCNTMLLVGPHGVGKTSAVYALAQQLSYKVFEVNASSSRQGRHILAQLQEATQSHQVAQKKDGVLPSTPPCGMSSFQKSDAATAKKEQKSASLIPNAFANFFKKAGGAESSKKALAKESPKKDSARKRRRPIDVDLDASSQSPKKLRGNKEKGKVTKLLTSTQEATDSSSMAGCLNLTSTSLILFDEVDLVFEEDTGFLQTVQHFINTTKIPIIMTTTDPGIGRSISAKFEQLVFKTPSLGAVTSHLQTVLLAAGMRTCPNDMQALAATCHGDLRQALLTLQFFALSGGGASREPCSLLIKPSSEMAETDRNTVEPVMSGKSGVCTTEKRVIDDVDSEDEFISLKPARKPARRIVDEDAEEGNSARAELGSGDGSAAGKKSVGGNPGTVGADALPPVHLHLYKSLLGVSHDLQSLLFSCLQGTYSHPAVTSLADQCLKLRMHKIDIILPNLLQLLPLPKVPMPDRWHPPVSATKPSRKRIHIANIYDSEASDEEDKGPESVEVVSSQQSDVAGGTKTEKTDSGESAAIKQDTCTGDKEVQLDSVETDAGKAVPQTEARSEIAVKMEAEKDAKQGESVEETTEKSSRQALGSEYKQASISQDGGLNSKLLSSFAHFYETVSTADCLLPNSNHHRKSDDDNSVILLSGVTDALPQQEESCIQTFTQEFGVEVEVHSARHFWQMVDRDTRNWRKTNGKELLPNGCCIPLPSDSEATSLVLRSEDVRTPERYQTFMKTVVSNLPLMCYHSRRPISLDYLPALRAISQAEHSRQVAKTKRRFHHYFDNIGLCLSKPTLSALCEEFPTCPDPSN